MLPVRIIEKRRTTMATTDARVGEKTYLSAILGTNADTSPEPAAAQLRLSVAATVSNAMRCGHKTIDVELVIVARSLQRLQKQFRGDQLANFELNVVQQSIARIAKVLRALHVKAADSAGDDAFDVNARSGAGLEEDEDDENEVEDENMNDIMPPVSGASAAGSPARMLLSQLSPTRQSLGGEQRSTRPKRGMDNPEMRDRRYRARDGFWPILLRTAREARGVYAFRLDPAEVKTHCFELTRDAPAFGLSNLATRLVLMRQPQVKLVNLAPPAAGPVYAASSGPARSTSEAVRTAFLASAAPGIVDFVTRRDLQCTPTASSTWGSHHTASILTKGAAPFMTRSYEGSSITIDFFNALVMPQAYAFSSFHHILPGFFPRTWRLLGSLDGIEWTTLMSHVNDESFTAATQTVVFSIPQQTKAPPARKKSADAQTEADEEVDCSGVYRYVRVINDALNSNGSFELQVNGFELYGNVMFVQPDEVSSHGAVGIIHRKPTVFPVHAPIDVAALTAKKKKK
jgi:hypothetical protein